MNEYQFEASRRYSPMKFTKSTIERSEMYSPSKRHIQNKLYSNRYYCHYSNALYMGGADSFKKSGPGILLLDSGACAITNYSHDNMTDFNVIFRDKSLTLMTVRANKSRSVTYRTGSYLFTMHLSKRGSIDKPCYLIDFKSKKLFRITYFSSKVDKKQQILDNRVLNNIFSLADYSDIIEDANHLKALNLNFNIYPGIESRKKQSLFKIGFFEKSERQQSGNGLCFSLEIINNPEQFDIILRERGYYMGKKMQKFGQKHFQNGNYYIGGFKNGLFDGYGLLVHPKQSKWTYNVHRKGDIVEIIQSSVNNRLRLSEATRRIHENQDSYIKDYVKFSPTDSQMAEILKQGFSRQKNEEDILDSLELRQRKANNCRRIKDDFVSGQYQENTEELIKQQLSSEKKNVFKPYISTLPIKEIINSAKTQKQFNQNPKTKSKINIMRADQTKSKSKAKSIKRQTYKIHVNPPPVNKDELQVSPIKNQKNIKNRNSKNKYIEVQENNNFNIELKAIETSHRTPKRAETNKILNSSQEFTLTFNGFQSQPIKTRNIQKISQGFERPPGYRFRDYRDNVNLKEGVDSRDRYYESQYLEKAGVRTMPNQYESGCGQRSVDRNCLSRNRRYKYVDDLDRQQFIGRMTVDNNFQRRRYEN